MKKGNKYGTHRVISPKGVLPQPADKLDNNMDEIYDNEIFKLQELREVVGENAEVVFAVPCTGKTGAEIDVDVGAALFAGSDIGEKTDGSCSVAGCCGNFLVGAARAEEKRCGQR